MLLKELASKKSRFIVGDLEFIVTNIGPTTITLNVTDAGDLKVGEFDVEFGDGDLDYVESPAYPNTLERLRKTGESNTIARGIRQITDGIFT